MRRGASISDLADKLETLTGFAVQPGALVTALFHLGEMATATESLDEATFTILGEELGYTIQVVSPEDVSAEDREAETRVFEQQAADKPENIRPKIVEGMLNKWLGEVALLNQEHVNGDKHDGKTIEQLRADLSAKTGENVVIRRFTRFAVGE